MTISSLQATLASGGTDPQNSPEGPGAQQAAKNREVAKAVEAINAKQSYGPGSELRFSVDRGTGRPLIQIVDRTTNEVISQIPPEEVIHLAAVLSQIQNHGRLA
ncbi:MAG TPA: flagellar protein FlaG [Bryobacterales bacterium]|nr:flagellar protein FlaG [Bryobacterales bacterium]